MDLFDNYNHLDDGIMYIYSYLATKETEELFSEVLCEGCQCISECSVETNCFCMKSNAPNYIINNEPDVDHTETHEKYSLNDLVLNMPIYECNEYCSCKQECGNKLVQLGPRNHLQIIHCPIQSITTNTFETKGCGLITTGKIHKGNFVCEYIGEVLSKREALRRFELNDIFDNRNYILRVNENFGCERSTLYIDPTYMGNIGRYINHSCEPNCILVPIRIDCDVPKICVFAKEDIEPDTEITFDYGDGNADVLIRQKETGKKCLCNSNNCRQFLPSASF